MQIRSEQKKAGALSIVGRALASFVPPVFGGNSSISERSGLKYPEKWMGQAFGGFTTGKAPVIGENGAMQITAFFACIQKISTDIAKLPLEIYKTTVQAGKSVTITDTKHPAYWLVHESPNNRDSAVELWEYVIAQALLRGVGYIWIERDKNGDPVYLWPLRNSDIHQRNINNSRNRVYVLQNGTVITEDDMIVIRNFMSTNTVGQFNQVTGLSWSADQYAAAYFSSGGSISGVIETPNQVSKDNKKNIEDSWNDGTAKGHSVRLLEYGLQFKSINSKPGESQLVETRVFNGEEICRIFGLHPSLVGFKSDARYESAEAMQIVYLQNTLMSHIKRIEQQLNKRLLRTYEYSTHAFKFNYNALLRADIKSRTEHYKEMVGRGIYSINEVRSLENMNPIEGGDQHLVQVNQIPLSNMEEYGNKVASEAPANNTGNE